MTTRVGQVGVRSPRLAERFCPRCGYRGAELQGPRGVSVFVCNACGEDLYSRPARSYLEMEGLIDEHREAIAFVASSSASSDGAKARKPRRRFWTHHRMRSVVFGAMLAVASIGFFLLVSLATVAVLSS